jgi:hypothetical protein
MVVYKPFFSEVFDDADFSKAALPPNNYNSYSRDYIYRLTPREVRALALLHEYRHLAGSYNGERNGTEGPANEAIIDHCLPLARKQLGNPTYIRAPQDPIEIAPIDGFPTTIIVSPAPAPPPPGPGAGDVEIGPLEGEPGYEEPDPDAPVIDPSDATPVILGPETGTVPPPPPAAPPSDPPSDPPPPAGSNPGSYPGSDPGYDPSADPGYDPGYGDGSDDPGYDPGYGDGGYDPGYDPGYDYGYGGGGGGGGGYDDPFRYADEYYPEEEYLY